MRKDDLLCELETDKITLELNAETDGVLSIAVGEGETVKIGAVIGQLTDGAAAEKRPAPQEEKTGQTNPKPAGKESKAPEPQPVAAAPQPSPEPQAPTRTTGARTCTPCDGRADHPRADERRSASASPSGWWRPGSRPPCSPPSTRPI